MHTHTPPTKPLDPAVSSSSASSTSLGLEFFRINQNNINPAIYPLFVARRSIASGKVTAHSMHSIFFGTNGLNKVYVTCM